MGVGVGVMEMEGWEVEEGDLRGSRLLGRRRALFWEAW